MDKQAKQQVQDNRAKPLNPVPLLETGQETVHHGNNEKTSLDSKSQQSKQNLYQEPANNPKK